MSDSADMRTKVQWQIGAWAVISTLGCVAMQISVVSGLFQPSRLVKQIGSTGSPIVDGLILGAASGLILAGPALVFTVRYRWRRRVVQSCS